MNNPSLTWNVDDIVGTTDDANSWRRIVWGCERPELLITEAAAFHDRGTDDTNQAGATDTFINDMPSNDSDYDQVRRPRGSLIVEMFNPTSSTNAPQRDLQYDQSLIATTGQPWTNTIASQPWTNSAGFQLGSQGFGVNLAQVAYQPVGVAALTSRLSRLAPGDCLFSLGI